MNNSVETISEETTYSNSRIFESAKIADSSKIVKTHEYAKDLFPNLLNLSSSGFSFLTDIRINTIPEAIRAAEIPALKSKPAKTTPRSSKTIPVGRFEFTPTPSSKSRISGL